MSGVEALRHKNEAARKGRRGEEESEEGEEEEEEVVFRVRPVHSQGPTPVPVVESGSESGVFACVCVCG